MQRFIKNTILIFALFLVVVIGSIYTSSKLCYALFNFQIPVEKTTLITGHSLAECAIDDSIYTDAINLSQSATGYFYSYLKIKELINNNPHVDTIILGISYSDIGEGADERFSSFKRLKSKLPRHLFICSKDELIDIYNAVGLELLFCLPPSIYRNMFMLGKGTDVFGSHRKLNINVLDAAVDNALVTNSENAKLCTYELEYLIKINSFCKDKSVKLILMHLPLHDSVVRGSHLYKIKYTEIISAFTDNTTIVDYSEFEIPDSGFADRYHLNKDGSYLFSTYIHEKRKASH